MMPLARVPGPLSFSLSSAAKAPRAMFGGMRPTRSSSNSIAAQLNFQEQSPGMRFGRYIVPPSHFQYDVVDCHAPVDIHLLDARSLQPPASVEREGFELVESPTTRIDASDDASVIRDLYPEVAELVRSAVGQSKVLVFDHVAREVGQDGEGGVTMAHADYTEETARLRLEELAKASIYSISRGKALTESERLGLLDMPWAIVNVWRSLSEHAVGHSPLALCDAGSVRDKDVAYYEIIYPTGSDRQEENHSLHFHKEQKWYVYPEMRNSECLLFVSYDARGGSQPRRVFHGSAKLPASCGGQPMRRSLEFRAVVFFGGDPETLASKVRFKNGKMVGKLTPHE